MVVKGIQKEGIDYDEYDPTDLIDVPRVCITANHSFITFYLGY